MVSRRRKGLPRGPRTARLALWAGLAVGGLLPTVGCQVEYAGMTLPSGKYMHDDIQYFAPGPHFPWANTQAASQRARMQAMGLDVPSTIPTAPVGQPPAAGGQLPGVQNIPGRPTNINVMANPPGDVVPPPPQPGDVAQPPPGVPAVAPPDAPVDEIPPIDRAP